MKNEYFIHSVMDDEGILIETEPGISASESTYQETCDNLAQTRPGNIVALRIEKSIPSDNQDAKRDALVWIDGEILPGKELRLRFADPSNTPPLSERVVIARTGTIFTADINDSTISSNT